MSRPEDSPDRQAFHELEQAVGRLLERCRRLELATQAAEARAGEMEGLLRRFTADEGAPSRLVERLHRLEEENGDMRDRIETGRAGVERLLARIRFLEEQR